jgi:hypothetical protein
MKEQYFVKIKSLATNQIKIRQLLLSKDVKDRLSLKIGKSEDGYLLLDIWR